MNKIKKFTIIELLVVIAILGILAALIMPAVFKVRRVADQNVNRNNLKQLGAAFVNYSADHNGYYPYIEANENSNSLFLLLPHLANQLELFYTPGTWRSDKKVLDASGYITNTKSLIKAINDGESVNPGYAYSPIDNDHLILRDTIVESDMPVVMNLNNEYSDITFVLYGDGSVKGVNGELYVD